MGSALAPDTVTCNGRQMTARITPTNQQPPVCSLSQYLHQHPQKPKLQNNYIENYADQRDRYESVAGGNMSNIEVCLSTSLRDKCV